MSNETCPLEHVVLLFSFPKVFLGKGDPLVEGLQRQFPPAPRDRPFGVTSVGGIQVCQAWTLSVLRPVVWGKAPVSLNPPGCGCSLVPGSPTLT